MSWTTDRQSENLLDFAETLYYCRASFHGCASLSHRSGDHMIALDLSGSAPNPALIHPRPRRSARRKQDQPIHDPVAVLLQLIEVMKGESEL